MSEQAKLCAMCGCIGPCERHDCPARSRTEPDIWFPLALIALPLGMFVGLILVAIYVLTVLA